MKFTSVGLSFISTSGTFVPLDSIIFPFDSRMETSNFIVTQIDGLDPPKIEVVIGDSLIPRGNFQKRNPQNREITMHISFNPDYATGKTSEDLRNQLYPFLAPKLGLPVTFSIRGAFDSILASAVGHISECEANPFSSDPEVLLTISCFSPYFVANESFLSNPSTYTTSPLIVSNIGTAPTGFRIALTCGATASSISLSDNGGRILQFVYSFLAGDIVTINTEVGSLLASVSRSGVVTNLIPGITGSSIWLPFHAGENRISIGGWTSWTLVSFSYFPKYWGV